MAERPEPLASWRPGPTRSAVETFLAAAQEVDPAERVACFDNDGTLWCERPAYVQLEFFLDVLREAVAEDPRLAEREEFAALLAGDAAAVGELGLARVGLALTGLHAGRSPEEFTARVRAWMRTARHPTLGRPVRETTYRPMLELVEELRRLGFAVTIVTGGGTEFVRAVSQELYGVAPESVVGTLVEYDYVDDGHGPALRRSDRVLGGANEGRVKVSNIQAQLGRRPILAAGNSGGDREMLEWTVAGDSPTLALLVDHDDDVREFAYAGTAVSFEEEEPITDVAARGGWTVVSMARDWTSVFAPSVADRARS